MKNKKALFASLGILCLGVITVSAIGNNVKAPLFNSKADSQTLELTSEQVPTIVDGNGTLELPSKFSTFTYTNASTAAEKHVVLGVGGEMRKTEASNDLNSVTITFSGSLKFEADWADDFSGDHYVIYPVSGTQYEIDGNYWKITALEANTQITSVRLQYGCNAPVAAPDKTTSRITTYVSSGKLASLRTIDGDIYLAINGNMSGYLAASDLTIRENRFGGNFQYIINGSKVEYTSPSTFTALFNLSNFYYNRDIDIDFYAHLYLRNDSWVIDGANDVRVWRKGELNVETVFDEETKPMDDGNKSIQLKANTWKNSDGYFYQVKLIMNTTTISFGIDEQSRSGGSYFEDTSVTYTERYTTVTYISKDRSTVPAPDMFAIGQDSSTRVILADSVSTLDYADGTRYKVSVVFDLTLFNKYYSGSELNTWCHLYINGETWDGASGDLKTSNTNKSTSSEWGHQKFFRIDNIGYNYWNAYSMLIIQLKPEA